MTDAQATPRASAQQERDDTLVSAGMRIAEWRDLAFEIEAALTAATARAEDALTAACKPWEHCVGEPPEWESPLMEVWQAAITWTLNIVATNLDVKSFRIDGGSESLEGDTAAAVANIVEQHAESRLAALEAALRELVRLKGLKDELDAWHPEQLDPDYHFKREEYEHCKPLAWEAARKVLSALPDAGKP